VLDGNLVNAPRSAFEAPLLLSSIGISALYTKKRHWMVTSKKVNARDGQKCSGFQAVRLLEDQQYIEERLRQAWLQINMDEYKEAKVYKWYPSGV
jgi:hypothetical protein